MTNPTSCHRRWWPAVQDHLAHGACLRYHSHLRRQLPLQLPFLPEGVPQRLQPRPLPQQSLQLLHPSLPEEQLSFLLP